jgi:hypothetical protein
MANADDPFQPPKAAVADVAAEQLLAARPRSVTLACRLLWATIVVSLLSLIPGVREDMWTEVAAMPGAVAVMLGFVGLMLGLEGWLIHMVSRRHGWARWVLLVLLALGWIITFSDFSASIEQGMAAVIIDLGVGIAEMTAAALLFLSRGSRWFGAAAAAEG